MDFVEILEMTHLAGGGVGERGCNLVCVIMTHFVRKSIVTPPLIA